jgi:hypothetical protein
VGTASDLQTATTTTEDIYPSLPDSRRAGRKGHLSSNGTVSGEKSGFGNIADLVVSIPIL